ncbi:MAG: hypothetical protein QW091_02870 [Candidatus Micrarchaeaceae archaeon]
MKNKLIYRTLSVAFAPQISPIYWFSLLYFIYKSAVALLISVVFASVIELALLFAYVKIYNTDFFVLEREKRAPLFVASITSYAIGLVFLYVFRSGFFFKALMLSYVINTIVAALITKYATKVSVHTWGISGPATVLGFAYGTYVFMLLLAVAAIVGYARIALKAHNAKQVLYALLISVLTTSAVVYLFGVYFDL